MIGYVKTLFSGNKRDPYRDFESTVYETLKNAVQTDLISLSKTYSIPMPPLQTLFKFIQNSTLDSFLSAIESGKFASDEFPFVARDQNTNLSKLHDFVAGKTVVIVGASHELQDSNLGNLIEQTDVIIRVNNGWPVSETDQSDLGSRADILFHCCNSDSDLQLLCWQVWYDKNLANLDQV